MLIKELIDRDISLLFRSDIWLNVQGNERSPDPHDLSILVYGGDRIVRTTALRPRPTPWQLQSAPKGEESARQAEDQILF